jgi:MOSC domain-containing protein YiiM
MRLISVNFGLPTEIIDLEGRKVLSAIIKEPVHGSVKVRKLNLDGDRQADLRVHGGENKAVYAYPSEHYKHWKRVFPEMTLPYGSLGENLTTEGMLEKYMHVGDQFTIGSAKFEITQPRFPCFKLAAKFGTNDMLKLFLDSELSGFYLKVLNEGEIRAGDTIKRVRLNQNSQTITSIVRSVKKDEQA